ncbi:hypothetical protein [Pseudomonas sp. NA-150]|uniref:hypothetical protein n=1 Tax=Pseudomonas sp. NA-150 TaxID=3367525 RepID=UPI0037C5A2C8
MKDLHTPYGVLRPSNAAEIISQPLDHRILKHARRWHLVGVFLRCSICGEAQRASQSAIAFSHFAGCEAALDGDVYPWRELADILLDLPTADAGNSSSPEVEG